VEIFKMAWRNVWRNRRRTLVTIAAMSLALLVMILYAGLMAGYFRDMERNILDLEVGDLQVFAQSYRDNPSLYTRIEDPDGLLGSLEAAGVQASGRLLAWGLAAGEDTSSGASFRGVDVERDTQVSKIHREVADGEWLDPADPKGVVLGRRLARTLGVKRGGEVVVLTQGADGAMAYDLFRVRGILKGIGDATDRAGLFMNEAVFRELLLVPEGAHQIIVRRSQEQPLEGVADLVRSVAAELDVKTWRQLLPTLASMLDSGRSAMMVMFVIVYIAIGIVILNAMLMAVFERIREFGVLKAIGVGPFEVLRLIVVESAIQTGIAVAIGATLAVPGLYYLSHTGIDLGGMSMMGIAMDPIWRAEASPETFTQPIVVLLCIVAVAVIYPALKAALIEPVEAMRHQ
jgi:ABC-type lipoprotein release transport system permease subunit